MVYPTLKLKGLLTLDYNSGYSIPDLLVKEIMTLVIMVISITKHLKSPEEIREILFLLFQGKARADRDLSSPTPFSRSAPLPDPRGTMPIFSRLFDIYKISGTKPHPAR